jgi:hypothetical protein
MGKFSGGVVNLSTKFGTNNWRGSAYEFFGNNVLNANEKLLVGPGHLMSYAEE